MTCRCISRRSIPISACGTALLRPMRRSFKLGVSRSTTVCGMRTRATSTIRQVAAHSATPAVNLLIARIGYDIRAWHLVGGTTCPKCHTPMAGVCEAEPGRWGNRRQPVRLREFA